MPTLLKGEDNILGMKCEVLKLQKVSTQHCCESASSSVPNITSASKAPAESYGAVILYVS